MSTITSLGSDHSVFTTLSNLAAGQQQVSQANASTGTPAASNGSESTQTVHGGHHHGGGKGGALFNQLQSAVTSALESAQASGSDTDPNQIIQDTISKVLNGQQNASTGSTTSSTDPSTGAGTSTSSSKAAFQQLLASNGIDAQQFQQDFQAAVQSAQNGGATDTSGVFSSFPPGSAVDTTA